MELKLDLTKEYGIVLEGGGAKGAYQIGAFTERRADLHGRFGESRRYLEEHRIFPGDGCQ